MHVASGVLQTSCFPASNIFVWRPLNGKWSGRLLYLHLLHIFKNEEGNSYTKESGFPEIPDIITQFNHLHKQQTQSRLDVQPGPIAVLPPIFCPPLPAHWSVPSVCTLSFVSNWFEKDHCPNASCHMFNRVVSHIHECVFGVERAKRFLERRAVAGDSNLKGI